MFKRRGFMLVVVSLFLGTFAAWAANNYLNNRLLPVAGDANSATVVAAALTIPYGTKVSERHLKIIQLPQESVPTNAFLSLEEAQGQVARTAIEPGEILLKSKFAEHSQGSTLAALVGDNMRAVTVRVNDVIGVAGFLLPGNRVDVLSTRMMAKTKRANTETVLHNIKVLAVDQTTATDKNEPVIVRAVTLELSPVQSLVLVKAKEEGQIQLTLRNPNDTQIAQAAPKPVAKKKTYRPRPVTPTTIQVIRGTRINKEKASI